MKLYIDTSVFGGYFEKEFQLWTRKLIDDIIEGEHTAVISDITLAELVTAPLNVKELLDRVVSENAELIEADNNARDLADKYLKEKIITARYKSDALHIAVATIHRVDALTSWNL